MPLNQLLSQSKLIVDVVHESLADDVHRDHSEREFEEGSKGIAEVEQNDSGVSDTMDLLASVVESLSETLWTTAVDMRPMLLEGFRFKDTFLVGDRVQGLAADGQWYDGEIAKDNSDGTYTLTKDNGDTSDNIKRPDELRRNKGGDGPAAGRTALDEGTLEEELQPSARISMEQKTVSHGPETSSDEPWTFGSSLGTHVVTDIYRAAKGLFAGDSGDDAEICESTPEPGDEERRLLTLGLEVDASASYRMFVSLVWRGIKVTSQWLGDAVVLLGRLMLAISTSGTSSSAHVGLVVRRLWKRMQDWFYSLIPGVADSWSYEAVPEARISQALTKETSYSAPLDEEHAGSGGSPVMLGILGAALALCCCMAAPAVCLCGGLGGCCLSCCPCLKGLAGGARYVGVGANE